MGLEGATPAAKRCNSSQILIYKSASPALVLMHSLSIIPLLSTCTLIGPITFLSRQGKAVRSALLLARWTSSAASTDPYIHMQRLHLFIVIQLHHCPMTCSPLASASQQRAIRGNMAHEALCRHNPPFVLLGLPLCHAGMASLLLAFTERMRHKNFLPSPFLL